MGVTGIPALRITVFLVNSECLQAPTGRDSIAQPDRAGNRGVRYGQPQRGAIRNPVVPELMFETCEAAEKKLPPELTRSSIEAVL